MNNVWGLILSYILIFVIIGISTFLQNKKIFGDEGARKFIHIGVSNWWILAMLFFTGEDAVWYAVIAPITFIFLNYLSYRLNILKAMERGGKGNLGTVYFPISLLILVILTFGVIKQPFIGAVGILVMGYGDGLAAVIGTKYGKHKLAFGKSVEGSLTMFLVSLVVSITILLISGVPNAYLIALGVALIATLVELATPKGLDNLSVPLFTSFALYLLLLI
ncbi:MAG: SEC59/DGK1/VTE5 family protein [Acholeplasmataceae bacterium]|nr:SEC59/DGK1/VTE5 family protein [Acholeplasmataceae bacterium]